MNQSSQDVLRLFGQDPLINPYGDAPSSRHIVSYLSENASIAVADLIENLAVGMQLSEPGNTIPTAIDSRLSSDNPGTVSAIESISDSNDIDFYRFQLDAGDTIAIDIDTFRLDSVIRLFDNAGNELAFSDDDPAPGEEFSRESYLEFTASESETYYIGVSGFNNVSYSPFTPTSDAGNSTGFYEITAEITPDDGGSSSDFQIDILFTDSGLSLSQQAIFQDAADRWAEIIVGDLPDVSLPGVGLVDDLLIRVSAPEIDGVGGVLGQAGPTNVRPGSSLPVAGVMEFDAADLDQLEAAGQLENVILHEMGHVLGIGTIWSRLGLVTGALSNNPQYTGAGAIAQYNDIFGVSESSIPVENTGGPGTRNSHWRESVFDNELMTGFLNEGNNPLSRMTVASLDDLGYTVDLGAADPYSPPTGSLALQASSEPLGNSVAAVEGVFLGLDTELTVV